MIFYKKNSTPIRVCTDNEFIYHIGSVLSAPKYGPTILTFETGKSFLLSVTNNYNHGSLFFIEVSEYTNMKIITIHKNDNLKIETISKTQLKLTFTNNHGEIYYIPLELNIDTKFY